MTVRIRGIYTTALTHLLDGVVQASPPIRERFDDDFPVEPADATVTTTDDRQGVGVVGDEERVTAVVDRLHEVGIDTLAWPADLPRGAVYAGEVTETLGSGAVVDVGDGEGFLPYSKSARRIEDGDILRVQVKESSPPWGDGRPVLDTTLRVQAGLATLVRGKSEIASGPELADLVPTDPPEGWGIDWGRDSDEAGLDALNDALAAVAERARAIDDAFADAPDPAAAAPHRYWDGEATQWVWFGRESRFALDENRRAVTATMAGHHRTKAAARAASAAVDFVEAVCADAASEDDGEQDFPFGAVTRQFGPTEGESLGIDHGKPDGRCYTLGRGEVTNKDADGSLTLRREMSPGGTYDALGVDRQAGDVAITKFEEGRWWYPTVYRGEDGTKRGTYVNVCTPVEVFPDAVRYVDLHVDVVKHADGTVERVDDDELDAAEAEGLIPSDLAEKARSVASAVENAL
jgi:protein associated with RNAse G/E